MKETFIWRCTCFGDICLAAWLVGGSISYFYLLSLSLSLTLIIIMHIHLSGRLVGEGSISYFHFHFRFHFHLLWSSWCTYICLAALLVRAAYLTFTFAFTFTFFDHHDAHSSATFVWQHCFGGGRCVYFLINFHSRFDHHESSRFMMHNCTYMFWQHLSVLLVGGSIHILLSLYFHFNFNFHFN